MTPSVPDGSERLSSAGPREISAALIVCAVTAAQAFGTPAQLTVPVSFPLLPGLSSACIDDPLPVVGIDLRIDFSSHSDELIYRAATPHHGGHR